MATTKSGDPLCPFCDIRMTLERTTDVTLGIVPQDVYVCPGCRAMLFTVAAWVVNAAQAHLRPYSPSGEQ